MNRRQILIVALVATLVVNFGLSMLPDVGFDLPLIGHVTLFDLGDLGEWGFVVGGVFASVLIYFLIEERRKHKP